MASIDFAMLAAMQATAAAQEAVTQAELTLGIDAQALHVRLRVGDSLSAIVLPPQGGSDLLEVLGHTVQAQLPPGIYPGETLALQVTGFETGRILVRNMGTTAPEVPQPRTVSLPQEAARTSSAASSLRGVLVAASIRAQAPLPLVAAQPQERMLARLRIPQTPVTLAAAKVASDAAAAVPRAFARLAALLAKDDVRAGAAPLRTLLPFLAKLDPSNPRALPQQIASYVENVVDGGESKLGALLDAYRAADVAHGQQLPLGAAPETTAARVAVGRVAIETDVKIALLALANSTSDTAPAQSVAVHQTLVAVTASQIAALASAAENPSAITLGLPVFYHEGGRAAHICIQRDAPKNATRMDGDNFHIGFVLDTAALGTISIDLETVGRSVSVSVKTERDHHAHRVSEMLPNLRARFEALRYHVASMRADVAPRRETAREPHVPTRAVSGAGLDLRA